MTSNNPTITNIKTHSLGYPRIRDKRELKKATEAYRKGKKEVILSESLFH